MVDDLLAGIETDASGAVTLPAWREACQHHPEIATALDTGLLLEQAARNATAY